MNKKVNRFLYPTLASWLSGMSITLLMMRGDLSQIGTGLIAMSLIPSLVYLLLALLSKLFIKQDVLAILACLSLTYLLIYKIFRIMHWPGTLIFLLLGAVLAVTAIIFALSSKPSENEEGF